VANVTIDGGTWISAGEVIRYASRTNKSAANASAANWRISNANLTIADNTLRARGKAGTADLLEVPEGSQRTAIRADRMQTWRIDYPAVTAYRTVAGQASKPAVDDPAFDQAKTPAEDIGKNRVEYFHPLLIVCSELAEGNTITAERSEDVVLPADPKKNSGNRIETLNDGGVRRTYLSGGGRPEVQNLPAIAPDAVANPKAGDFVMLKREDGTAAPAFYDGKQWRFLAVEK
jgi:hypothetical protein